VANEFSLNVVLRVNKTGVFKGQIGEPVTLSWSGSVASAGSQLISSTTPTRLNVSDDMLAAGISVFQNKDTTNFIQLGRMESDGFHVEHEIGPKELQTWRPQSPDIYALAEGADCYLQFLVTEAAAGT